MEGGDRMDTPIPIVDNIFWVGVNDLETHLFEAIWPLPQGVCYNSYIINDERVALIDTVKRGFLPQLVDKIKSVLKDKKSVDYLIINHMEPDHSGSVKILQEIFPDMQIVGNRKTADFVKGYFGIENTMIVEDGDTLDLGGRTLKFFLTPMVHWPETMMSYDEKNKVLFSGDAFGGFGTLNGGIFDDEVDLHYFEDETLRYFSNIVAKYSSMVQKAMAKLKDLEIRVIAATHGPIFRKSPSFIVDMYDRWSRQETEKGVTIVYASMYGHTQIMAESVARALAEQGVEKVRLHNISKTHLSHVLTDAWRFKGLILGSCTYNTRLFPLMEPLINTLENDRIKNRVIGIFGSYSWSGGAVKVLTEFAHKGENRFIEPVVEAQYAPSETILEQCALLGKNVAKALEE